MSAHIGPPEFEPAIGKPAAEIVSWLLSSQGDGTHWQNCAQYCIAPACRYLQMSPHAAAVGTPRSWLPPPVLIGAGKRATKSASKILVCMAGLLRNHASGPSASCWGLGHTPPPSAVQTRPELSVTSATTGPGCDAMARSLSSPTATTATSSRVRMSVTIAVAVKSSQQYCNPSPCLV